MTPDTHPSGERGAVDQAFADEIAAFVDRLSARQLRLMWRWILLAWVAKTEQELEQR